MDDADSVPTIKLQSAKRCLNFTVLISDRWQVVVIHIHEEIFILNGGVTVCLDTYCDINSVRQHKCFYYTR